MSEIVEGAYESIGRVEHAAIVFWFTSSNLAFDAEGSTESYADVFYALPTEEQLFWRSLAGVGIIFSENKGGVK